jgi:hypothetical protein
VTSVLVKLDGTLNHFKYDYKSLVVEPLIILQPAAEREADKISTKFRAHDTFPKDSTSCNIPTSFFMFKVEAIKLRSAA